MYIVIVKYSKMNTFYSKRLDMTFFFTVAEKKVLKNQLSVNMYIFWKSFDLQLHLRSVQYKHVRQNKTVLKLKCNPQMSIKIFLTNGLHNIYLKM